MACQALNSFAEILFSENQQDDADADIENLRRQMDGMNDAGVHDNVDDINAKNNEDDDGMDYIAKNDNNAPSRAADANAKNTMDMDIPKELTIETPLQDSHNNHITISQSTGTSQAAEEAIFACRSADVAEDVGDVINVIDDFEKDVEAALDVAADAALNLVGNNTTGTIAIKNKSDSAAAAANADASTVETSPLDVTQDISDSSFTAESAASNSSSTGSSKVNSRSKANTVSRSRSHMSSLHHLKANLYNKANQLRELDTLVSWQSRRTCKLSDPVASANFDESVEVSAVEITLANRRTSDSKRGEDPPEQLEEVKEENMIGDNDVPEPSSDLEPSPEQKEWSDNYAKLADQYRQNGGSIAHITQSRTAKPNVEHYKMRMFVEQQRKAAKKRMLSQEQIVKLVAVGIDFGGNDTKEIADSTNPAASNDNDVVQEGIDDGMMKEISQCASF